MLLMPFHILGIWIRGLLALAIPILAILCLKWWYDDSWVVERAEVVRAEVVRVESVPSGEVKTTVREDGVPGAPPTIARLRRVRRRSHRRRRAAASSASSPAGIGRPPSWRPRWRCWPGSSRAAGSVAA